MTHKIEGSPPPISRPSEAITTAAQRAGGDRSQPIEAATPSDSLRLTGEAEGLQALQRELGTTPPGIDLAKVNALRSAIADGSYAIDAGVIADRMLAMDSELSR